MAADSLGPRLHPHLVKVGLVKNEAFLGCAESAFTWLPWHYDANAKKKVEREAMATYVPRLQRSYPLQFVEEVVSSSVKTLVSHPPTKEQLDAVKSLLSGKDVFLSLPTGSGKSVCFACLPLVFDTLRSDSAHHSIVVVVSPLTSLMIDQVAKFSSKGLKAAFVGDKFNAEIQVGAFQLVYISPEAMVSCASWREMFRTVIYRDNLMCLAVDEAHLVEKWGKDFRTDFARVGEIRSSLSPHTNILALTATATNQTRSTIISIMDMKGCHIINCVPNKVNIKFAVTWKPIDVMHMLQPVLLDLCTNGVNAKRNLIFCRSYDDVLTIFKSAVLYLNQRDALYVDNERVCDKYDACTASDIQKSIVASFTDPKGHLRLVVATVAFAMGLDAPDIRQVIHWGPPNDVELYVQESGRAGRDNEFAQAVLYYDRHDISDSVTCHASSVMKAYCRNTLECRRAFLVKVFGDSSDIKRPTYLHNCCDICALKCSCHQCRPTDITLNEVLQIEDEPGVSYAAAQQQLSRVKKAELTGKLLELRTALCSTLSKEYLLVGPAICTGLSENIIKSIVDSAYLLTSEDDLLSLGITSPIFCNPILELIQKYKE